MNCENNIDEHCVCHKRRPCQYKPNVLLGLIKRYHDIAMDRQKTQMGLPHDHGLIRDQYNIEMRLNYQIAEVVQRYEQLRLAAQQLVVKHRRYCDSPEAQSAFPSDFRHDFDSLLEAVLACRA